MPVSPYHAAQRAITDLKGAIHAVVSAAGPDGVTNAQVGRMLGIHVGHSGHVGHIPRTLLALMENEGVVKQNPDTERWTLARDGGD